ncbi:MAG TPA: hypothetical protein VGA84_15040 [Thermoanaerobaculia bacterium]
MSGIAIAWTVVGIVVVAAIGWGVGVMGIAVPDYLQARVAFTLAAIVLSVMTIVWAIRSDDVMWWRILASLLVGVYVFLIYPQSVRWTYSLEQSLPVPLKTPHGTDTTAETSKLSGDIEFFVVADNAAPAEGSQIFVQVSVRNSGSPTIVEGWILRVNSGGETLFLIDQPSSLRVLNTWRLARLP